MDTTSSQRLSRVRLRSGNSSLTIEDPPLRGSDLPRTCSMQRRHSPAYVAEIRNKWRIVVPIRGRLLTSSKLSTPRFYGCRAKTVLRQLRLSAVGGRRSQDYVDLRTRADRRITDGRSTAILHVEKSRQSGPRIWRLDNLGLRLVPTRVSRGLLDWFCVFKGVQMRMVAAPPYRPLQSHRCG